MSSKKSRKSKTSNSSVSQGSSGSFPWVAVLGGLLVIAIIGAIWLPGNGAPNQSTDVLEIAASLNDESRYAEAKKRLKESDQLETARGQYLLGIAEENTGKLDEAIAAYTKCLEFEPDNSDALNNRAVVYGKLNKLNEAIADFQRTVEINPNDYVAWTNLGLAFHSLGQFDKAIEKYDQAEKLTKDPEVPFQRGNTNLAQGNLEAALADFDRAVAQEEAFAIAHYKRAVVLLSREQYYAAAQALADAKKHDTEMELKALILEMENSVEEGFERNLKAVADAQQWLMNDGWEITASDRPEFAFYASRLPVAGASEAEPGTANSLISADINNFYGLVLQNKQEGLICSQAVAKAFEQQPEDSVALFVFDLSASAQEIEGLPRGLTRVEFDWKPTQDQFKPTAYAINLPPPVVPTAPETSVSDNSSAAN